MIQCCREMLCLGTFGLACVFLLTSGCGSSAPTVQETTEGYRIAEGTRLTLDLETPLNSNTAQRGDEVRARVKKPVLFEATPVVPASTLVRGLVKRADPFSKAGDRARLLLLFDQMVLGEGKVIPIVATLDTDQGFQAVKVDGQALRNAKIVGHSALAGKLVGDALIKGQGAEKGLAIGAGLGSTAVFLSDAREVDLPEGTELVIRLDEPLFLPR